MGRGRSKLVGKCVHVGFFPLLKQFLLMSKRWPTEKPCLKLTQCAEQPRGDTRGSSLRSETLLSFEWCPTNRHCWRKAVTAQQEPPVCQWTLHQADGKEFLVILLDSTISTLLTLSSSWVFQHAWHQWTHREFPSLTCQVRPQATLAQIDACSCCQSGFISSWPNEKNEVEVIVPNWFSVVTSLIMELLSQLVVSSCCPTYELPRTCTFCHRTNEYTSKQEDSLLW